MGSWREGWFIVGHKLTINQDRLSDPATRHTLVHEARHATQHEFVDQTDRSLWDHITGNDRSAEYEQIEEEQGITREEIDAWRENSDDRTPAPIHPGDDAAPRSWKSTNRSGPRADADGPGPLQEAVVDAPNFDPYAALDAALPEL